MAKLKSLAVVGVCLFASAVMTAKAAQPAKGQQVSGTYTVEKSALGVGDVSLTLQVELTSSADATLDSKSVQLRSLLNGTTQIVDASFSLPAHGNVSFTATVTIPDAEYKLWQRGARPLLVLTLASTGGDESTQTVALLSGGPAEAH
jgi:hypothetical protein